jgi:hypothetical protein
MAPIVALVGLVFCATFLRVYVYGYPSETQTSYYFDVSHKQLAEEAKRTGGWGAYFKAGKTLPGLAFYYPMEYGGMNCREVRRLLQE